MQSQRIQKHQSENTKHYHSASKIAKIKTPSERNTVNLFRFPVGSGVEPPDISLTPQNINFLQRTVGNQAVGHIIQAKLKIGQPGDKYEREADQVAEEVMSMPEPEIRQKPT